MEMIRIRNLYDYVKTIHSSENFEDCLIDCGCKLRPSLRNYQIRAVKWMLKREREKRIDTYSDYDVSLPTGGILADEMGLGKTVEVLACILCNPFLEFNVSRDSSSKKKIACKRKYELLEELDNVEVQTQTSSNRKKRIRGRLAEKPPLKEKSGLFSSKYNALRAHYENALSQMSFINHKQLPAVTSIVQCFCDNNDSEELDLVQCDDCNKWLHAECIGIKKKVTYSNVKCPQCWTKSPLVPSKATLIITPSSILEQWISEIEKHVNYKDFKLLIYNGVKNHNFIQPTVLADNEIVLTTYNVLCSDLNFIPNDCERKLRHAKRYFAPSSPLPCIKFWRVCLDEAQMVEGYTTKTAVMASQLNGVHRWAVTGTPIQKSIHDLYGLIHFLRVSPFEDPSIWQALNSDDEKLFKLLSHLMWRSSKQDVLSDLGVPPQTVITHWLHFSPVEGYFYRTIHTECASSFKIKLSKFADLNVTLTSIDRKQLQTLLLPLLGVRQACTHPQVVRGKFVRFKHTMTMEELMGQMVSKARLDADVALRQFVSALHGIAAINIIECDWAGAVENYRRVLRLSTDYKDIKVDSLQMIHCLYNLAEVLENHGIGIPPTLRDSKLRDEAQQLELNYLQNYEKKFRATHETLNKLTATVAHLCRGQTLSLTSWWEEVINSETNHEDLLNKIRTYLDDNDIPGQQSITSRLTGLHAVHREFAIWIATADSMRVDILDSLRFLQIQQKSFLFDRASICHLNQRKRKKGMQRCPICQTELLLKKYEAHIFSVNRSNINLEDDSDESADEGEGEGKKLKETKLFKSSKEGSWKPTPHERMLHVLANHAKRFSTELAEDGSRHLLLLETIRKEFKWMRALWRNISEQIYGTDELAMAKLRLRLPIYEDELDSSQKKKTDLFIMEAHEVPIMLIKLQQESIDAEAALKRTTGTLFYLQNLQKSGGTELDPCPVCKESLKEKWSVLHCGHCYCFECIPTLLKMGGNEIDCPLCRVKTPKENVSYVVARPVNNEESFMEVKGSHSTKVTAVISELLSLLKKDKAVKVLIFSTWEKVLDIIRDALVQNDITFRRLTTGEKFQSSLSQFKAGSITALLLPLKLGAKGLNLTEATHIFFVEPVLNPAEELQAVGRIHRIGQTKPTFVHRFVVHNTIEERMLSSLETGSQEEWAKENITLRQLNDLFILREDNSNREENDEFENEVMLNENE